MQLQSTTIIVPTKNEQANIVPFLKSIPPEMSLVVVDDSEDDTPELVKAHRPNRTILYKHPGNIASARQLGADRSTGDWLLYTDADMIFDEEYFDCLNRFEVDPTVGAIVGGKYSRSRYRSYYQLFSAWLALLCFLKTPAGSGSNMLIRRKALYDSGGFDTALSCNEDSYLIWKIHCRGYRVVYSDRLRVYEIDHRRLDRGLVKKTVHSVLRCLLLYADLFPQHMRRSDWGYWDKPSRRAT